MDDIREGIRRYILETHLPGEPQDSLGDDTPLLTSGILDSLAAWQLVTFIEERFGVSLNVYDTSVERFDRIADMAAIVERKRAETADAAAR